MIEILIVLGMIALLTASVLSIASFSESKKNLTLAADQLRVAIRTAQSYALSIPQIGNSGEHICGFGVYTTSAGEFVIFYNATNDSSDPKAENCKTADYSKYNSSGTSTDVQSYKLTDGIDFTSQQSIFFKVPYADVYNDSGSRIQGTTTVDFEINDGSADAEGTRTIKINSFGKIE